MRGSCLHCWVLGLGGLGQLSRINTDTPLIFYLSLGLGFRVIFILFSKKCLEDISLFCGTIDTLFWTFGDVS